MLSMENKNYFIPSVIQLRKMDLIAILIGAFENPLSYSIIFFIYAVLAAVILPIPVEIGLFNPYVHPIWKILILALGKGVGAYLVFQVGATARTKLKNFSVGGKVTRKILDYCEGFVKNYGYYGLLIILSIPLMIDSISLYLFSLLNPKEKDNAMVKSWFVVINIIAGAIRGAITLAIFYMIGVKLV